MSDFELIPEIEKYVKGRRIKGATTNKLIDNQNYFIDHAFEKPASYIVRVNGSYYEAIDSSIGKIDYGGSGNAGGIDGTDASAVIQAALNNLTSGRTWQEKVLLKGDIDLNNTGEIELVSNSIIEVQGRVKQPDISNKAIFTTTGNISNMAIIGGRYRNPDWDIFMASHTLSKCKFIDMDIDNTEIGFLFQSTSVINDCDFVGIKIANLSIPGGLGISFYDGSTGVRNRFINLYLDEAPIQLNEISDSLLLFINSIAVSTQKAIVLKNDSNYNDIIGCRGISGQYGLHIYNSSYNRVLGGVFRNNSQYGIVIQKQFGTCTDNSLRDVVLENNATAPIYNDGDNTKIKDVTGYVTENSGTNTQNGDGSTTVFNIPHGCDNTPTFYTAEPLHVDSRAGHLLSIDATNIIITFDSAPPAGTGNVKFAWKAEV